MNTEGENSVQPESVILNPQKEDEMITKNSSTTLREHENPERVTYIPNVQRSTRISKPPEVFDSLIAENCLLESAEDPMTVKEAFESLEA